MSPDEFAARGDQRRLVRQAVADRKRLRRQRASTIAATVILAAALLFVTLWVVALAQGDVP
jgi:hypothetical protein